MPLSRSITFLAPLLYKKEVARRMFYYPRIKILRVLFEIRIFRSFAQKQISHLLFHFISITCELRLESLINKTEISCIHRFDQHITLKEVTKKDNVYLTVRMTVRVDLVIFFGQKG